MQEVLSELAAFFERRIKMRRQVVGIFTYPIFVLIITMGVVWFMLTNVVPMFANVFDRFGEELPGITKFVVAAANATQAHSGKVLLVLLSVILFLFFQRKRTWFRKLFSRIAMRLPVFGGMVQRAYLARFCQSMNLLVGSSTPLVQALELVSKMIRFYPMEIALADIRRRVMRGTPFNVAMKEHRIFPSKMVSLVKVAEEVNQLEQMFSRLNKNYTAELEQRSKVVGSIMEPLMILIIGGLVGLILIAMYLPMFQLSSAIG